MRPGAGRHAAARTRRGTVLAGIGACLLAGVAPAGSGSAEEVSAPREAPRPWGVSVGLLSGATRLDPALADYQWDVTPRLDWGAQVLVGRGRAAAGVRLWRAVATQRIEAATPASADVRATSSELVAHVRLMRALRCEVVGIAGGGLLHLGYSPDQVSIASSGGPTTVDLEPLTTAVGSLGLALRRPLGGPTRLGIEVDHRVFNMQTAHRNGAQIEYERRTFGDWCARLELAWVSRQP